MSTTEEEVIRLKLDNSSLASTVSTAIGLFDKLKNALTFSKAGKSIDEVQAKASRFSLQGMANGVDGISLKFAALSTVGITALANITNRAVNAGLQMAKAFTIAPVAQGFQDYETQINSIQTVLANTGLEGAKGIAAVNEKLDELNHYADKTIYSFPEMAKNVGTFTAAGVGLQQSVDSIKGIANLAALSGSNSEQASTAMYQLSQAIAANKVGLQDWNSVVNAGMGGEIFKKALFNTGKLKGTLKGVDANTTFDEWTKSGNSFRDSLQDGWITGEVLTDTLSQFTGDLTDAQLQSQGYNKEQIAEIQKLAKTANSAAQDVKTFSQLKDTLKEGVGSSYANIFRSLFGDIGTATKLWTSLSNVLAKIFIDPVNRLGDLIAQFVNLGGRTSIINIISRSFKFLSAVIAPIKAAFREIFPAKSAKQLFDISQRISAFAKGLTVSAATADKVKRTFKGVFAIFAIAGKIISAIATEIFYLVGSLGGAGGSFLDITAKIGDFIVRANDALTSSNLISSVFYVIGEAAQVVVKAISAVASYIAGMFDKVNVSKGEKTSVTLDKISEALSKAGDFLANFGDKFSGIGDKIGPVADKVADAIGKIGDKIAAVFSSQSFDGILDLLKVGLLGGILVALKKFLGGGINVDIGGGIFEKIGGAIEGMTGKLQAVSQELKAKALMEVAIAIGVFALALLALSFIPPDKLANALVAMAAGIAILVKTLSTLNALLTGPGVAKIVFAAAAITLLSVALLLLAGAMLIFAHMSWEEIGKGLSAVTALLLGLSVAMKPLQAGGPSTLLAAASIIVISVALSLLAGAVKLFSLMSWDDMFRGLAGVGIALVGIAAAMYIFPPGMPIIAAGLLILSFALMGIYKAVAAFATMSWADMAKGLVGLAGALVGIGAAMLLFPPGMIVIAAGLFVVSLALGRIQQAVAAFGGMSWGEIAKGLVALAGSLLVIAAAVIFMTGTLAGAAALLLITFALKLFVPILITLGGLSWGTIAKGIGILAVALLSLGVLALVMTPFIGAMYSLGGALIVVGAAVLLFGAGIALLGVGLTLIAAGGGAAIAVIIGAVKQLGDVIPKVAVQLAKGLVTFLNTILQAAPGIVAAVFSLLGQILTAIPTILPQLATAITSLITTILQVIRDNAPNIIQGGIDLLLNLLTGIKNNIGAVVTSVGDIIVAFLTALGEQLTRIVDAGVEMLFKFLEGVAKKAGEVPGEAVRIVGIFIKSLVTSFPGVNQAGLDMITKLISGIGSKLASVGSKALEIGQKVISSIVSGVGNLVNKGGEFMANLISGIGSKISSIGAKAGEIGSGVVNGIINGIGDIGTAIWNKVKGGLQGAIDKAKDFFGIGGPSKLWQKEVGVSVPLGIAKGVDEKSAVVGTSIDNMNKSMAQKMRETVATLADSIQNGSDFQPRITPVLDLTEVEKSANNINGIFGGTSVEAKASSNKAKTIKTNQDERLYRFDPGDGPPPAPSVSLTQNNYSPKALSALDIYRGTNNQLSMAKKSLTNW